MYRSPRLFWLLALAVCFSMRRKIWKLVVWAVARSYKELEVIWSCICSGEVLPFQRCFVEPQPRPKKPRATMLRSNAAACTILEWSWNELDKRVDAGINIASFDLMYVESTRKIKVSMTGRLLVSRTSKFFSCFTGAASTAWTSILRLIGWKQMATKWHPSRVEEVQTSACLCLSMLVLWFPDTLMVELKN